LFYGTGGAAYGLVKNSATITVAGVSAVATSSDLRAGWTAGGGVEGAFGGGWSAKLEYLYMDERSAALASGRSLRRLTRRPTTSCASV
jgi:outer membrane immunogenic protein